MFIIINTVFFANVNFGGCGKPLCLLFSCACVLLILVAFCVEKHLLYLNVIFSE